MAKRRSTRRLETIGLLSDLNAPLIVPAPKPRDKRQPRLQFDPMPERIEPCMALLKSKPPSGPDWLFEVKWDGYRLAVHVEANGGVRIITRGGHDWTSYFPSIATAAKELGPATMILDGEAVVLDEKGVPNFGLLQRALGGRKATRAAHEAVLYAFDLLYFDGHDLTGLELSSRRHLLGNLLDGETGAIRLSEEVHDDGEALLRHACAHGLEGIIAKNKNAPYRSGRTGDWLKIKCVNSESFAVIGYEPSQKVRGSIASLLLAARNGDKLVYAGNVGTGFSAKLARDLRFQLDSMRIDKPAVPIKGKNLVFVEPTLVAEVNFSAWTHDGRLRHASFKGLRDAADHAEILQLD
ncbi:ATP-dependent DNA ligase [Phyllobacterium sp. BT25]|uniref:DNA ligase (ATP) n=1 Tax=Phyllobacterium pellucidum TaxID=2740464 RepID=A0A849VIT4_9HYPH|nr:non-homologous end-joining DNA ligase [Phyllobacterium pellucidum]NTS29758.1 ATP-dependent DNA ligase [Phyllobacterium pellucidum]